MGGSSRDARGQSNVIGLSLILAIVVLGTATVVTFGSIALTDSRQQSQISASEHAMTQFDSQASQVALGDSRGQSVQFGDQTGTYKVLPGSGHVTIVHTNFDGGSDNDGDVVPRVDDPDNDDHDDDVVVYESDLGAFVYENGDHRLAYQGGGVWKRTPDGGSTMVSPPEFHYRLATLTFPVIRVNQGGGGTPSASGSPTISVTGEGDPVDVYSTRDRGYPDTDGDGDGYVDANTVGGGDADGDGGFYANPAANGSFRVDVRSEYYQAWAEYFRTRTSGRVTVFHDNQTARIELVSLGTGIGRFDMPSDRGSVQIRGLRTEGHAVSDFKTTLKPDDLDNANFNNLQWSLYAEDDSGEQKFELHLTKDGGSGCSLDVDATIFYTENGNDDYEGWHAEDAFTTYCDAEGNLVLEADFTGSTQPMTYQALGSDDVHEKTGTKPQGNNLIDTLTLDEHPSVSWESSTPTYTEGSGDTEEMGRLVEHYLGLMGPNFDLVVYDKSSNTVSEERSAGELNYGGNGQFVTFLHVSENDVSIDFE